MNLLFCEVLSHLPVVISVIPVVKVHQKAIVHHICNCGNAYQRRIHAVHSFKFHAHLESHWSCILRQNRGKTVRIRNFIMGAHELFSSGIIPWCRNDKCMEMWVKSLLPFQEHMQRDSFVKESNNHSHCLVLQKGSWELPELWLSSDSWPSWILLLCNLNILG